MERIDFICTCLAEIITLSATTIAFIYGIRKFFKKGTPLFLQSITMAMGCHSLGTVYRLCFMITHGVVQSGFTPAYLGRIGFFLFFVAAGYGHLDRIVDDKSPAIRRYRYIAIISSVVAAVLLVPNLMMKGLPLSTKISVVMIWIPAMISVYYNMKHIIIPDFDFGFVKAIKPYSLLAICLAFAELFCVGAWNYRSNLLLFISSVIFAVLSIAIMVVAKKGAEKWTI